MTLKEYGVELSTVVLLVVVSAVNPTHISEVTSLRTVTNFEELINFYRILQREVAGTEPQEPLDPMARIILRRDICNKIFASPYFEQIRQVKLIDIEEAVNVRELYNQHGTIFNYIFTLVEGFQERFRYSNPYVPHEFRLNGVRRTDHFIFCVVKGITSPNTFQFFLVSREYNVNIVPEGLPIAGRFVFEYGLDNTLRIESLAEQPAVGSELKHQSKFVEYQYIKHRPDDVELGPRESDPICGLTRSNKLRLCSSIFSSKILRYKYKFTPTLEYVDTDCQIKSVFLARRKRVKLLAKIKHRRYNKQRIYEEWMISCTAARIGSTTGSVTYFISRGDAKNTAFAYKYYQDDSNSEGRVMVKHYFKNVSVVGSTTAIQLDLSTDEVVNDDSITVTDDSSGDDIVEVRG